MNKTRDKIRDHLMELHAYQELEKYYVKVAPGVMEYFADIEKAKSFAEAIGAEVKPLD